MLDTPFCFVLSQGSGRCPFCPVLSEQQSTGQKGCRRRRPSRERHMSKGWNPGIPSAMCLRRSLHTPSESTGQKGACFLRRLVWFAAAVPSGKHRSNGAPPPPPSESTGQKGAVFLRRHVWFAAAVPSRKHRSEMAPPPPPSESTGQKGAGFLRQHVWFAAAVPRESTG